MEQRHIFGAFRFVLSRVTVPTIPERVVSVRNVDQRLAHAMAQAPEAQPLALVGRVDSEVQASPGLSLFPQLGDDGVRARRVALLVVPGTDDNRLTALHQVLLDAGAVARHMSSRLGTPASVGVTARRRASPSPWPPRPACRPIPHAE